jgi:pimeloyl-ACP methyl ester carboxylesterase
MVNKSINNIPITPQDVKTLLTISMGSAWIELHPNFLETIPSDIDLFAGIPPNTIKQQNDIAQYWQATNWSGVCDELTKVSNPTLIITGTHDINVPSGNSLVIAGKIPGAWLVQIKDAGHALFDQYPENHKLYYKHFFRRQLLPVKKVYEIPDFSIFKNTNDAASHHSDLRVGQQGYKFWTTLASSRLTRE